MAVVFYANSNKQDIGVLKSFTLDMQISMETGDNNFEVKTPIGGVQLDKGYYIYSEGSEYGGIVDKTRIDTKSKTMYYDGRTWRGMLESKIIVPPANQDYYTISGDLNDVIDSLVNDFGLDSLFYVTEASTGITVTNYQFYRYTDVYSGLMRLLSDKGYKLSIEFNTAQFKCKLSAVPIVDYGENQEVTSDLYDFDITQVYGTVNHLIALGQGELKDRTVVHLYADANGNISTTQTFTGTQEIVSVYDYSNAETTSELIKAATERFKELIGSDKIKITLNNLNADVGDKLTAYEQNTGIEAIQYIQNKVITVDDDTIKVQYSAKTTQVNNYGKSGESGVDYIDYIVAQGQTGFWLYQKWNSGLFLAWGAYSASVAMTNAIQNTYYGNATTNISALGLVHIDCIQVTGQASGSFFGSKIDSATTTSITISDRSSASSTTTVNHHIAIQGRWK